MIEQAWNEYRGWARRARMLQTSARRWGHLSFACCGFAAILGTAAAQAAGGSMLGRALAFAAAVVAAVTPVIGREILSVDSETRWTRARATAEAIKSECFRFAAQLGEYAESAAKSTFVARRDALAEPAERHALKAVVDREGGRDLVREQLGHDQDPQRRRRSGRMREVHAFSEPTAYTQWVALL